VRKSARVGESWGDACSAAGSLENLLSPEKLRVGEPLRGDPLGDNERATWEGKIERQCGVRFQRSLDADGWIRS
jgi:hypothetical protein